MIKINENGVAIWWSSGMEVDGDGSPRCYSPNGKGLDYTQNAGHPGDWFGILTDENGEPLIQTSNDPCPGFYISTTALQDKTKSLTDPKRYVNSESVSYISIPGNTIKDFGLKIGNVGIVYNKNNGLASAAICADISPKYKYGEGSILLAKNLRVNPSPKNGGINSGIVFLIFKNSNRGWPRSNTDIAQQSQALLNSTGMMKIFY